MLEKHRSTLSPVDDVVYVGVNVNINFGSKKKTTFFVNLLLLFLEVIHQRTKEHDNLLAFSGWCKKIIKWFF